MQQGNRDNFESGELEKEVKLFHFHQPVEKLLS
jgi:hypothetical protein